MLKTAWVAYRFWLLPIAAAWLSWAAMARAQESAAPKAPEEKASEAKPAEPEAQLEVLPVAPMLQVVVGQAAVAVEDAAGNEVQVMEVGAVFAIDIAAADPFGNADPQSAKLLSKVAVDNALVRRVCDPNAEQLKKLNELDAKWVKDNSQSGKPAGNFAQGVLRIFAGPGGLGGVQPQDPAETAKRLTNAYKVKLREILTPDQCDKYQNAVTEREQFRREANAECIVAVLDDRLSLNAEQRKEIRRSLAAWPGVEKLQAYFYFQNQAYLPQLPAAALKALNASQRKIFDGIQKADFQSEMFDGQPAIVIAQ
jgi:hypothetical protein